MNKLEWLEELCIDEDGPNFDPRLRCLTRPVLFRGQVVATDACIMVAVTPNGECTYKDNEVAAVRFGKLMDLPGGKAQFLLGPLKDWAARRYDDGRCEPSVLHGCVVDRRYVWRALKNLSGDNYRLDLVDAGGIEKSMLLLDGDGWRVWIMGVRNVAIDENTPVYQPETAGQ